MNEKNTTHITKCIDGCITRDNPDGIKAHFELHELIQRLKIAEWYVKDSREYIDFLSSKKRKLEIKLEGIIK
jgi:hypothetical protein